MGQLRQVQLQPPGADAVVQVIVIPGPEAAAAGEPVPVDVAREPGDLGPVLGDVAPGGGAVGVEEVELGPGIGRQRVVERGRGRAAIIPGGAAAVAQQLQVLLAAIPGIGRGQRVLDPRAEQRQPGEPGQRPGAIEPRVRAAPVFLLESLARALPVAGGHHLPHRKEKRAPQGLALRLLHRAEQPVVGGPGIDPAERVPAHRALFPIALVVVIDTALEQGLGEVEIGLFPGHQPGERGHRGLGAEIPRSGIDRPQRVADHPEAGEQLGLLAQGPGFHRGQALAGEEQPRVIGADRGGPVSGGGLPGLSTAALGQEQQAQQRDRQRDSECQAGEGAHRVTPGRIVGGQRGADGSDDGQRPDKYLWHRPVVNSGLDRAGPGAPTASSGPAADTRAWRSCDSSLMRQP